jgi:hypothetical protein
MTRKQFSIFTAVMALAVLFGLAAFRPQPVNAQSTATPLFFAPQAANSVAGCVVPTGSTLPNAVFFCFVNTGTPSTSGLFFALNGGTTWTNLVPPAGGSYTATSPVVVTGTVISCPTCVTGPVVTSFNTRTGAVQLTKADVTATGTVAAVPSSIAPLQ